MSSPAITAGTNANLSATNIPRANQTRRRRLQRFTWMRYKRVRSKTRCLPSRRGRTESASGISLGSTDAPTARCFWTSKMESNALHDESGWIDVNADHADWGKERGRERRRPAGARMESGRYFHSQRITTRVCRFWVANAARTHPPNVRYGRNVVLSWTQVFSEEQTSG